MAPLFAKTWSTSPSFSLIVTLFSLFHGYSSSFLVVCAWKHSEGKQWKKRLQVQFVWFMRHDHYMYFYCLLWLCMYSWMGIYYLLIWWIYIVIRFINLIRVDFFIINNVKNWIKIDWCVICMNLNLENEKYMVKLLKIQSFSIKTNSKLLVRT